MNEPEPSTMTAPTTGDDVAKSLVLNALADYAEDGATLEGEASREIVECAFRTVTDESRRDAFADALADVRRTAAVDEAPEDDALNVVAAVTDDVYSELLDREVHATVIHETGTTLSRREVSLYNYARSQLSESLERLPVSRDVYESIRRGALAIEDGRNADALRQFEGAIDAGRTVDDEVASRVTAALSSHWNGADERALDYVEEALHFDTNAWTAKMVGMAASHSSPETFREGTLSVKAYFRARIAVPERANVQVEIGLGDGEDTTEWTSLGGDLDYMPIERLAPETKIRLRLAGPLSAIPTMHAYYLSWGVVDEASEVPRTVDHVLLDGPVTADATERLRLSDS